LKIKTQLWLSFAVALGVAVLAAVAVGWALRASGEAEQQQRHAQATAREIAGLLVLTQEYARSADQRAAQQWWSRHSRLSAELMSPERPASRFDLSALQETATGLSAAFSRLMDVAEEPPSPLGARRRELLVDQLLTDAQVLADGAFRWSRDAAVAQAAAEQQLQQMCLIAFGVLVGLLLLQGVVVRVTVLRPLARIQAATEALGQGDTAARVGSQARNELGNLSRSFDATVQALAERKLDLERAENRIRSILENAPDAFIGMDEHGAVSEWNAQAEATFGWRRDEVVGRPLAEVIIPPAQRAAHNAGLARFMKSGTGPVVNQRLEVIALHRDGHEIPVQLSVSALRLDGLYIANAFLHDITQRKADEARLAAVRKRLDDVTNHIPALVGYFDAQERCEFANEPARRTLGLKADTSYTLREALGEASYRQHQPHVHKVLRGERISFEDVSLYGGEDLHFQAHLVPDRSAQGEVRGFYIMTFDVTALKRSEEARAADQRRLKAITDNLPALISYVDSDERMTFANETFRSWLGVDPAAMTGRSFADVLGPVRYEQRRAGMRAALGGERIEFEMALDSAGAQRILRTTYIPDVQPDGRVAGVYGLSADITAMKEVEGRLAQLARIDSLTGLANRRQFEEIFQQAAARSRRHERAMALMFLDVDHFKSINDGHGHGTGDAVLKAFASRLLECVRSTDTVARLAGDEFVIVLEGLHERDEAALVARKIVERMREPVTVGDKTLAVTTSIGVALCDGHDAVLEDVIALADDALYQAKREGRARFAVAVPNVLAALGAAPG
jgi:diguanylate cyclase (GGDEF)-like protein/PAS domain S-box-containing protein